MTKKILLVAFVVAVCTTVALTAQGRGRRRMPPPPALLAIDVNEDGELSNDEIDSAAKSLLTLDQNGDGNLTIDELTPEMPERGARAQGGPPGGPPGGGPPRGGPPGGGRGGPPGMGGMSSHPLMKALDQDGDGELFDDEITQAARSLDRLDVDDDDVVSAEELSSRGRGRGRGGFGRGSRDGDDGYETTPSPSELRPADGTGIVKDMTHFRELSYQGEEVMVDTHLADQEFVKFQIESADGEQPQLYFMNTNKFRAHPMFMQHIGVGGRGGGRGGSSEPGQHRMRGVIVYRPMLMSPSGSPGMFTFEFEPNDSYAYKLIRIAYDQLTANAKILRGNLSYNLLPRSKVAWEKQKDVYVQGKIPVFHAEDVYGEVGFLPLNKAKSYGRLRLMEVGERPGPRDIVLYRSLPNEMPRVAGVLTGFRQTPLSHVNLRAVQDNVPNAFVVGAATKPEIIALIGKYVYYKVHSGGYELREAKAEEVEQHFAAMRPSKKQVPGRDLTVKTIRSFADVGFDDGVNVGVKAANLAAMRTFGLPGDRTPNGFAVPFAFYDAFMLHNGFYKMARTMMAIDEFSKDANFREQALAAFRKAIKKGKTPKWIKGALADVQKKFAKDQSIRCRSSTNNEDLPGFSGAGLYDSFTHHPKEGKLHKSIRQVYASMWNYRAFEEREFFRIDHMAAAMGVVLHANSKDEQVNGVAVTKDVLYQAQHKDMTLYYVNAQMGEDLVTNPDAASVPEELLLSPRNPRTDRVLQRSNRVSTGQSLLSMEHRQQLRSSMRVLRDRFARLYDRYDDPTFAMEVEFKVSKQGELLIKQARPWIE